MSSANWKAQIGCYLNNARGTHVGRETTNWLKPGNSDPEGTYYLPASDGNSYGHGAGRSYFHP